MPKGMPISEETKRKMVEGRRLARERKLAAAQPEDPTPVEEPQDAEPIVLKTEIDDVFDGILTAEEKAELDAAAQKKAREDQRKAVRAAYAKDALDRARRAIGEMPADEELRKHNEEEVRIYIDMPRLRKPRGGEHPPEPIIIDQMAYVSGKYYTMSRGRANYIMWLQDQARRAASVLDGRSRSYYDASTYQVVEMGGVASGGGSLGPGFDALHKRPN